MNEKSELSMVNCEWVPVEVKCLEVARCLSPPGRGGKMLNTGQSDWGGLIITKVDNKKIYDEADFQSWVIGNA